MATPRSHAKNWCFTLNNPDLDEEQLSDRLVEATYAVFQLEVGQNGTPHFQGYVMFPDRVYFNHVKALLPDAHLEVAKGSPKSNRDYCTKSEGRIGDFVELGIFPESSQGRRSDLLELHSALKDGLTQSQYADRYFDLFFKNPNLVQNYKLARIQARSEADSCSVILLYGPADTGKSRLASCLAASLPGGFYRHSLKLWWDGYFGERSVIFDDFCGSSISFGDFKRTMDRYPLRVPVKGSSCELAANRFFLTSNFDPKAWWSDEVTGGNHSPIFRRITRVFWFHAPGHFTFYRSGVDFAKAFYNPQPVIAHAFEEEIPLQEFQIAFPLQEEALQEIVSLL